MLTHFYDIESVDNAFTLCDYHPENNHVDVYCLIDDQELVAYDPPLTFYGALVERIYRRNEEFAANRGTVSLYDLSTEAGNRALASVFGLTDVYMVNDPSQKGTTPEEFRPVCDTDPNYDESVHPYMLGYNSYNYDTTMLALYFNETWNQASIPDSATGKTIIKPVFTPTAAVLMRKCNNYLFTKQFKNNMPSFLVTRLERDNWTRPDYSDRRYKIRKNMLMSGRHLDVARINEKMGKVALKRLLGMLGRQILESNRLSQNCSHLEDKDQLLELIAYNCSDVINLEWVFKHPDYYGNFKLKQGLLKTYPELIYEKKYNEYAPNISPKTVRRDRLFIDSSSAQLSTKALCPYGHFKDIETVSFMYPSEKKAKELGIPRVNVLEESKKFFYGLFPQPEVRARFDKVYNYYKSIEGKNFNASQNYAEDYQTDGDAYKLSDIPSEELCMPYFDKDGLPTTCFINFSTGGLHGAEYNKKLFDSDMDAWNKSMADMEYVKSVFPDPIDLRKAKSVKLPDGTVQSYKTFLTGKSTMKAAEYRDFTKNMPLLFKKNKKGLYELNKKYTYTSADPTNHEDFTSYYPILLCMLNAFFNEGLGYDRYAEIFDQKQDYGFLMKKKNADYATVRLKTPANILARYDKLRSRSGLVENPDVISDEERAVYDVQRDGTKLILNSASGAADAGYESNIRMNNMIISMRIIGQLFTWRIGQAQTYHGAKVTSTNTDGLFTVMDADENKRILEEQASQINVEIVPEPTFLISKDSNNRLEMNPETGAIEAASGGTLGRRKGPHTKGIKSLAHPAIIDWALSEYLIVAALHHKDLSIEKPFDADIGMAILKSSRSKFDNTEWLLMMQNVIASSPGSDTYIFGTQDGEKDPIIMQHYNRIFMMKDGTPDTITVRAAHGRKITPAQMTKRIRDGQNVRVHDPLAETVLAAHGITPGDLPPDKEMAIKKLNGIEENWPVYIMNQDLYRLPDTIFQFIVDNIDYNKYLALLSKAYTNNWMNKASGRDESDDDDELDDEIAA